MFWITPICYSPFPHKQCFKDPPPILDAVNCAVCNSSYWKNCLCSVASLQCLYSSYGRDKKVWIVYICESECKSFIAYMNTISSKEYHTQFVHPWAFSFCMLNFICWNKHKIIHSHKWLHLLLILGVPHNLLPPVTAWDLDNHTCKKWICMMQTLDTGIGVLNFSPF